VIIKKNIAKWYDHFTSSASYLLLGCRTSANTNNQIKVAGVIKHRIIYTVDLPYERSEFDIYPGPLLALLKEELRHYPGFGFDESRFTISEPFAPLIHHWDSLMGKATTALRDPTESALEEPASTAKQLLDFLNYIKEIPLLQRYFASREERRTTGYTTFEFLWTFFPPGCLVLAKVFDHDQLMMVEACNPPQYGPQASQDIFCRMYDWDGTDLRKEIYKVSIQQYTGKRHLRDLLCFPFTFPSQSSSGKNRELKTFIERGKLFLRICRGAYTTDYLGIAWLLDEETGYTSVR
jgi:hypothetical protein